MPAFDEKLPIRRSSLLAVFAIGVFAFITSAAAPRMTAVSEIGAFNKQLVDAFEVDTELALYAEDSVSLPQGEAALVGKRAIAKSHYDNMAQMRGYRATWRELEFHDIQVCGSWAFEWATGQGIIQPPNGAQPINLHVKLLLVLHRGRQQGWRIEREMWNLSEHEADLMKSAQSAPSAQQAPVNCVAAMQYHRQVECAAACSSLRTVNQVIACNQCVYNFRCP
jgi:ketosteroid isomerase-like protein